MPALHPDHDSGQYRYEVRLVKDPTEEQAPFKSRVQRTLYGPDEMTGMYSNQP